MFKHVPWSDWPFYTLNKAFAVTALVLLVVAAARRRLNPDQSIAPVMEIAASFILIHIIVSLTLFTPAYYGTLFTAGRLTVFAGTSMMVGAIATAMMVAGGRKRGDQRSNGAVPALAVIAFASGLHAGMLGVAGWFTPAKWPGMMPPITLISFLIGLTGVVIALMPKRSE